MDVKLTEKVIGTVALRSVADIVGVDDSVPEFDPSALGVGAVSVMLGAFVLLLIVRVMDGEALNVSVHGMVLVAVGLSELFDMRIVVESLDVSVAVVESV